MRVFIVVFSLNDSEAILTQYLCSDGPGFVFWLLIRRIFGENVANNRNYFSNSLNFILKIVLFVFNPFLYNGIAITYS